MTAVQTCTEVQPSSRNSAASCQLPMPPMPEMGTGGPSTVSAMTCCTMFNAMGLTAGPQYPPWELMPSTLGRGANVSKDRCR
jgi:hypothetical protein